MDKKPATNLPAGNKEVKKPMDKEAFLKECYKKVEENFYMGSAFTTDLKMSQFDELCEQNNLDPAQAIQWLTESGNFIPEVDNHSGWYCPNEREKHFRRATEF